MRALHSIIDFWLNPYLQEWMCPNSDITKTCLYNLDPLKPHFYVVKLGFTGVCIIFLISAQKHRLWYLLEPPRRGGSNEYPQCMFWVEIWKISDVFYLFFFFFFFFFFFLSENFMFLEVRFSIYLNRRVFVMAGWAYLKNSGVKESRAKCGISLTRAVLGKILFLLKNHWRSTYSSHAQPVSLPPQAQG